MKIKYIVIIFLFLLTSIILNINISFVKADTFSEINNQLEKLDFSELVNHFNGLNIGDFDFYNLVKRLINGENNVDVNGIFDYILNSLTLDIKNSLPVFLSIITVCIFCSIVGELKSSFLENSTSQTVNFICFLSVASLISIELISIYQNTSIIIENITKTCEIMSPIMLTLMVSSGQNVSVGLFNPVVVFLSTGLLNLFIKLILPLILTFGVFSIIDNLSTIKVGKFTVFISSLIKWTLGISVTIFGFFLTTNGIIASTFDGISIKIANYAISNSVPIVGGFIKDGFNVVLAGSYLIKSAVGISGLIGLFYFVISPIINMLAYSLLLRFTAGVLETFNMCGISALCTSASKFITYLIISILMVGVMIFITILLMIYSFSI